MFNLIASSNKTWRRTVQLLVTLLTILLVGRLISIVPVMQKLVLFRTFKAADAIWFLTEFAALCMFYFLARYTIEALPKKGGVMYFLRGIADPLTSLVIVILFQDLLWQLLAPFVSTTGKTIYFSTAILLILALGIWLALMAYQHGGQLTDSINHFRYILSRLTQPRKTICDHCKAEVFSKARFCDKCGHKIPETRRCPECGVIVDENQNYCRDCGTNLNPATTPSVSDNVN